MKSPCPKSFTYEFHKTFKEPISNTENSKILGERRKKFPNVFTEDNINQIET
jgi:hypothetical protein